MTTLHHDGFTDTLFGRQLIAKYNWEGSVPQQGGLLLSFSDEISYQYVCDIA